MRTNQFFFTLALFFISTSTYAQLVNNTTELNNAINAAMPGTTITLADGTWNDVFININKDGTSVDPIIITAQNAGAVFMTGNSRVYMKGAYLTVSGLIFQAPSNLVVENQIIEPVIELQQCDYCKILNNKIDSYNGTEAQKNLKFKWILTDGQYNEIAYNSFIGKYGVGSIINDNRNSTNPDYLKIHHNYFADRTPINGLNEDNDQDAIRIGNSSTSLDDSFTEVYDNYFYNFFGEVEVISNKSGQNKYYNNTFRDYAGTLTLRHGDNCEVYGNYFFAENNTLSGGIRVIGEGHKIYNNYIEGVNSTKPDGSTSRVTGGINVSNGRLNSALNGYYQVKNAQVVNNTFVNCDYALRIGTKLNSDLDQEPENLTVANNIMYNTSIDAYQIVTAPSGASVSEGNMTNVPNTDMTDDGNFHRLESGSNPIDAGVGNYSFLTEDVLGGNRDANFDAGAEEFQANGTRLPYTSADVGINVGFMLTQSNVFTGTGEVIITEYHNRPLKPTQEQLDAALPNNPAGADLTPNEGHTEWFEIYNTTDSPIVMDGWTLTDASSSSNISTISSFTIEANSYAVFSGFNMPDAQGGVVFNYFYDYKKPSFNNESSYADAGDTSCPDGVIIQKADGTLVDEVRYDYGYGEYLGNPSAGASCRDNAAAIGFPSAGSSSKTSFMLNVNPSVMNATDNDLAANWSYSTIVYDEAGNQIGTPGLANNQSCFPHLNLSGQNTTTGLKEAKITITSAEQIGSGATVDYSAGTSITLNGDFEVLLGAEFHAYILGCQPNVQSLTEEVSTRKNSQSDETSLPITDAKMGIRPNPFS